SAGGYLHVLIARIFEASRSSCIFREQKAKKNLSKRRIMELKLLLGNQTSILMLPKWL
ncbi:MAG: hypothetical protein EZS28_026248, partial [Streblomastix strix]